MGSHSLGSIGQKCPTGNAMLTSVRFMTHMMVKSHLPHLVHAPQHSVLLDLYGIGINDTHDFNNKMLVIIK